MKRPARVLAAAILTSGMAVGVGALAAPASPASAESMARGVSTCGQLRAQHPEGIAKTKKAAKRAVKAGYQKPFVCKHLYLQLKHLDRNRNKSVCEVPR